MTIHNHEGLRAELVDNEAIALYAESVHCLTITLDEWNTINKAMEGMKNEQV